VGSFYRDLTSCRSADPEQSTKHAAIDGVTIRLGSIHSVKGLTVDAILVVQSEVYRGPAANQQVMDLEAVLPHAFGIANSDSSTSLRPLQTCSLASRRPANCWRSPFGATPRPTLFWKQRGSKAGTFAFTSSHIPMARSKHHPMPDDVRDALGTIGARP
jgi:hypothetical protein